MLTFIALQTIARADSVATQGALGQPALSEPPPGVPVWVQVLAVVAAVVSAVAAAVAAKASRDSVQTSAQANIQQESWRNTERTELQRWRHAERLHVYYNAIVARPILDAIQAYGQLIRTALTTGADTIQGMQHANMGALDVQSEVSRLLNEDFARLHKGMAVAITEAAEAWTDPALREAVRKALEHAQTAIAEEGVKLLNVNGPPNFDAVLNDVNGRTRRIVMKFDPGLQVLQDEPSDQTGKAQ